MLRPLLALLASLCLSGATGQALPDDLRSEQIFLAPLSSTCAVGDTLRVEGQVTALAAGRVDPYSHYLYLELISDAGSVVTRQKVACHDRGYFQAAIPTDSLLSRGTHYLRAYTRLMQNFSTAAMAVQPVMIGRELPVPDDEIAAALYADGGVLVPDAAQTVTAVLSTPDGYPVAGIRVALTDAKGDTVGTALTSASGYATFTIKPDKDQRYSLRFDGIDTGLTVPEIAVDQTAVKIQGAVNGKRLVYCIAGNNRQSDGYAIYEYDRMNGLSMIGSGTLSGAVSLDAAPAVATLFLADNEGEILAQCSVAAPRHREGTLTASDTVRTADGVVRFSIDGLPTDSATRILARIVPEADILAPSAEGALMFCSDFRSELPFPKRIFMAGDAERQADLRAWLSGARFSRFDLKDMLSADTVYRYMPEFNMEITGTAMRMNRYPAKNGSIVIYNTDTFAPYDTIISNGGQFRVPVDDFAEGTEFFIQYINKAGKAERLDIAVADEKFPPVDITHARMRKQSNLKRSGVALGDEVEGAHELPDVVVKARVTADPPKTSKLFYGIRAKDREAIEKRNYLTLKDILKDMPFLKVKDTENPPRIISTRTPLGAMTLTDNNSTSSDVQLLIDGTRQDPEMFSLLFDMPTMDIESVEYLANWEAMAYTSFGLSGAVLVTTRGGLTSKPRKSRGTILRPMGLSLASWGESDVLTCPKVPGQYRILVDVIGSDGIQSFEHPLTVLQ